MQLISVSPCIAFTGGDDAPVHPVSIRSRAAGIVIIALLLAIRCCTGDSYHNIIH